MRSRLGQITFVAVILSLCLLLVFPAAAQDKLTEKYTFESGATFNYPEAWALNKKSNPLFLLSEQTKLLVLDYAALQDIGIDAISMSQNEVLQTYFSHFYPDRTFKESKIEMFEVAKRQGVSYDYSSDDGRARVMVIPFTNGSTGIIEEISLAGKLREEDTVVAMVESFDNSEEVTGTTATVATKSVNCTVSTTRDDTVHVRVGPGENRSAIVFLSAGSSYKVLGQAKAKDGSKWWKLDKGEVAPDKAANEVWVKQDDVKATGDCEKVPDVNAPPVVPIVNAPPANTGSNNDNGNPPTGGVPQPGSWVISYSNGKASCFGTGTVDVPINDPSEVISVSISGSTINLDGDILRFIGGNTYQGIGQIKIDGQNVSTNITVQVLSPTQIVGSLVGTSTFSDTSCSVTIPIIVTKR